MERDMFTCQNCRQNDKTLDVHHKVPKRKGGLDVLENLISLCRKCHKSLEPALLMGYPEKVSKDCTIKVKPSTHDRLVKHVTHFETTIDDVIVAALNTLEQKK